MGAALNKWFNLPQPAAAVYLVDIDIGFDIGPVF